MKTAVVSLRVGLSKKFMSILVTAVRASPNMLDTTTKIRKFMSVLFDFECEKLTKCF